MFTPRASRTIYCSRACYGESLRGEKAQGVKHRTRTAKGHPIAPACGIVGIARINLYEKIGPDPQQCHWCGQAVYWKPNNPYDKDSLVADHLDWHADDDSPSNLVPSCGACNAHRRKAGDSGRIKEGEPTVLRGGRRTRALKRDCEHCRSEFLVNPAEVKKGKGRFCSRSCARKGPTI